MIRYFVDSSALIALAKVNDDNHLRARTFLESLSGSFQFVTSDYILDETLTRLSDSLGAEKAAHFVEKIFESRLYKIIFIEKRIFESALKWLKKYADKPLSFTDCTSFVLMQKFGLKRAFAFDDDFRKVGFEMVP
jgi:predicted nucleic acid-binding protein